MTSRAWTRFLTALALLCLGIAPGEALARQRIPVTVTSSVEGPVPPDKPIEAIVRVMPRVRYERLRISVRGLEGVRFEPLKPKLSGSGPAGKVTEIRVRLTVSAGRTGAIVVDVAFDQGRRHHAVSLPFSIWADGADRKLDSVGRLDTDTSGGEIIILEGTPR